MPFGPGETFERYAIEALIGRGGMGEVYRAVDTRLRRKVALKIIRPDKDRPDAAARLYREARAAAALTHPNAVAVHDVGEAEGLFYIVMELVVGQPLLAFVGDPRVTVAKKIAWLTDVARAIGAAHRAGIIHRDVKPSNVMVSEDGFAKVLDFGLARPLGPIDPVSFRTQEGRVLGTLRYMAPEQVAGADADARSDQYAFGLTAYELLAGTHPGGALIEAKPKRIDEIAPEVSIDIALVVDRTLARAPDARFASMDDVVAALESAVATQRAPLPAPKTPMTTEAVTDAETAETMSAAATTPAGAAAAAGAGIGLAMRSSSEDLGGAARLAALANATTQPSAKHRPHESTLVSKEAPSALVQHRPPDSTKPSTKPPPDAPPPPPPASPTKTIVISVAVLAVAAFAGTYLGSRRNAIDARPAVTVTSSVPPPSASASASASAPLLKPIPSAKPRASNEPHLY